MPSAPARQPFRIACIGEALVELSEMDFAAGQARLGVAGDALNTATYLARLLPADAFSVRFVTRIGTDPVSEAMLRGWQAERIDTSLIGRDPLRRPGIYAIHLDAAGERSFGYWRDTSAARTLFTGEAPQMEAVIDHEVLFLSGITLAILAPDARAALVTALARRDRARTRLAFDPNYRPALWDNADTARTAFEALWPHVDIALPSLDDEERLYPRSGAQAVIARLRAHGVAEGAVKDGARGPTLFAGDGVRTTHFLSAVEVRDTTGAGDAFDAGYLAARLTGHTQGAAAEFAHLLASAVIGAPGAILPRGATPALPLP